MEERFEIFTGLINKISRSIKKIKNQEMAGRGLRGVQVSCLYYLFCREGLTSSELCDRCEEDKATISRSLDYLEKNGYLESISAKRYKAPLKLTEKGREVGKKIADKIGYVLDEISVGMNEEERTTFYRNLAVISNGLEAICRRFDEKQ